MYRKITHTDQYLNFQSHHPLHQKLGVVRTLLDRAEAVIKNEDDQNAEITHIENALSKCGYPKWSLKTVKRKMKEKGKAKKKNKETQHSTEKKIVSLPYIKGTTEQLIKVFKKYNTTVAVTPGTTLRRELVHPKDKIDRMKTTGCVYRIPCKNCEQTYIGETGRSLQERIGEHRDEVQKESNVPYTRSARKTSVSQLHKSAVTDHAVQNNHIIDWENTKPIVKENNLKKRQIKEAISIRKSGNTMNRDQGAHSLSNVYNWVLMNSSEVQQ